MKFNSLHEAYAHIAVEEKKMENDMQQINTQVGVMFSILEDAFWYPPSRDHAKKQMGFLYDAAKSLEERAARLTEMAMMASEHCEPKEEDISESTH